MDGTCGTKEISIIADLICLGCTVRKVPVSDSGINSRQMNMMNLVGMAVEHLSVTAMITMMPGVTPWIFALLSLFTGHKRQKEDLLLNGINATGRKMLTFFSPNT